MLHFFVEYAIFFVIIVAIAAIILLFFSTRRKSSGAHLDVAHDHAAHEGGDVLSHETADMSGTTEVVADDETPAPDVADVPVEPKAQDVPVTTTPAAVPAPAAAPAPVAETTPPAAPTPAPAPAPAPAAPVTTSSDGSDDLLQLKGVGPKLNDRLKELGITSYAQIAGWSDADVARIDDQLGTFKGRIQRDNWIDQAQLLNAGDKAGFEAKYGSLGK